METSTSSALSLPSLLRSRVGSVWGNLRQHRFVSVTSQVGGQSLGIGTCLHSRCQFCPLLARFLNLPVLGSAPETSSVVSGPQGCILWPLSPSPWRVPASPGLSDHPPCFCDVWPVCLSLGLVHCASRACREPVAHLLPFSVSTRMAWPFSFCNPMAVTECIDSLPVLFSSCGCVTNRRWMC